MAFSKKIGVLALQGGFDAHLLVLSKIKNVQPSKVTNAEQLKTLDGLIIPGGESSTFLKLLEPELKQELVNKIKNKLPIFGTCAGLILLAKNVDNPTQESFGAIDIDVKRNAYGRQLESFETKELTWEQNKQPVGFNAIFIRAPKISRIGQGVEILMKYKNEPVLVKSDNILAASFHPELNQNNNSIHQLFVDMIRP